MPPLAEPLVASLKGSREIVDALAGFSARPQHRVGANGGREELLPKDSQRAKPRTQGQKVVVVIPLGRDGVAPRDSPVARGSDAGLGDGVGLRKVLCIKDSC